MTPGSGIESTPIADIAFWVISGSVIIAAIAVVQLRDLFRAALFLVVAFLGVAGMFVLLRAEFLAVVQVLIYVGAISVLIIFAILMTRDVEEGNPSNRLRIPAGLLAMLFFVAVTFVAVDVDWELLEDAVVEPEAPEMLARAGGAEDAAPVAEAAQPPRGQPLPADTVERVEAVFANTVPGIAGLLLRDFVLAFEAASLLLLAAVIGALALVRERSGEGEVGRR